MRVPRDASDLHGKVTEYTYYNDDRLREVIVKRDGQSDRVFTYSYDAAGRLSEIVYPTSTGIKAVFDDGATPTPNPGWNENGQLTHLRYLKKDGMGVYQHFHSFVYEYDASGNRKKFIDTPENTANKITWEYSYDWLNRLTEVKRGDGAATPTTQRVYAYDESDNRTFLDDHVNNLSLHYTYDAADQILEIRQGTLGSRDTVNDFQTVVESFTHNADGMMTQRVVDPSGTPITTNYTWDEFDNLVEIDGPLGTVANSYSAKGLRERRVGDDGSALDSSYANLLTVGETLDPAAGDPVLLSFLLGHRILGFDQDGDFFYFLTDGLSSVRVLIGESGGLAASYVNNEYGSPLVSSEGGGSSPMTYVGGFGLRDETLETGLYYARQRWFDPTLGRFLSRDLIPSLNRYIYTRNPVNYVDVNGLKDISTNYVDASDITTWFGTPIEHLHLNRWDADQARGDNRQWRDFQSRSDLERVKAPSQKFNCHYYAASSLFLIPPESIRDHPEGAWISSDSMQIIVNQLVVNDMMQDLGPLAEVPGGARKGDYVVWVGVAAQAVCSHAACAK